MSSSSQFLSSFTHKTCYFLNSRTLEHKDISRALTPTRWRPEVNINPQYSRGVEGTKRCAGNLPASCWPNQDTDCPTLSRLQALGAVENPHSNPQDVTLKQEWNFTKNEEKRTCQTTILLSLSHSKFHTPPNFETAKIYSNVIQFILVLIVGNRFVDSNQSAPAAI